MKTTNKSLTLLAKLFGVMSLCCVMAIFTGCNEDISEEDYAIKTEPTMTDYLTDNPQKFSLLKAVFDRVRLGNSGNASTMTNVLSARGNYTLFAPNDSAMNVYLQEQGVQTVDELPYELAQLVAYSCLIDNEDQSAYEEAEFDPNGGAFGITNFNNRLLNSRQDSLNNYWINNIAMVLNSNIEVSNGMIHEVGTVITPSVDNLYERIAAADNMKVFSYLMRLTGWNVKLDVPELDVDYEEEEHELNINVVGAGNCEVPQSRYIGFTGFVETDSVYIARFGLNPDDIANENWDAILPSLLTFCKDTYPTSTSDDYKDGDNAVNRFVAYHFVYGKMAYNRFVQHYNEYNYKCGSDKKKPQTTTMPTNVWDYYTTMGDTPGLIKITQVGDASEAVLPNGIQALDHPIFLNRLSQYDNTRSGDYHETGVVPGRDGILVSPFNGDFDNDAINGYYFPINDILTYDEAFRIDMGKERIRIDATTMMPEMATNSFRANKYRTFEHGYFDNIINESPGTQIAYLHEAHSGQDSWKDYQGDEFFVVGLYDFTVKLPPVPHDGMYEVRMGSSNNQWRGMVQIYFGTNPNSLQPVGLPFDLRLNTSSVSLPWKADVEDDMVNLENDKNLRNQGYMKGPRYFIISNSDNEDARETVGYGPALRRIVTTEYMYSDQTYYIRFKSALKNTTSQFFFDYLEFVPTIIYNGVEAEDIW